MKDPLNFLCITSYFKGGEFLKGCKDAGNNVYLVTSLKHRNADWPWEHIDEVYYMEDAKGGQWDMDVLINSVAYLMRSIKFDRFIALDDFDVEKAARLREVFRIPGMGDSTAKYFRDKLAMRVKAESDKIPVPAFTSLFHDADIENYTRNNPPPWMLKPRTEAGALGIKKVNSATMLWELLEEMGDERYKYILEKFTPGSVYHVDSLTANGKIVFSRVCQYLDPPFSVMHGGGIFRSRTLDESSADAKKLMALNRKILKSFGMEYSATHTEFIKDAETGAFLFLETSSRVGGAHLCDMIEKASGVNLFYEWARLESAVARGEEYIPPQDEKQHAGIITALSRYEYPDTSSFNDKEVVWRMNKEWHIGLIVKSENPERIEELLESYAERYQKDFYAVAPAPESSP